MFLYAYSIPGPVLHILISYFTFFFKADSFRPEAAERHEN